jgi:hypothetical protein
MFRATEESEMSLENQVFSLGHQTDCSPNKNCCCIFFFKAKTNKRNPWKSKHPKDASKT